MGAWGYEPFENDTALDWVSVDVSTPLLNTLSKAVEDPNADPHEAQAAAFMFLKLIGHESRVLDITKKDAQVFAVIAIDKLTDLNTGPHALDWDKPGKYRDANQKLINALRAVRDFPEQVIIGTNLMAKILSGEHG